MIQLHSKPALHETTYQYLEKVEEQQLHESKELPNEQPQPALTDKIPPTMNEAGAETNKEPKRSCWTPKPNKKSDFVFTH